MKITGQQRFCAYAILLSIALPLAAQQPRLTNAKVETRPAAAGLEQTFKTLVAAQSNAAWIGYAVRAVAGDHQMCCYSSFEDGAGNRCCRGCSLESRALEGRGSTFSGTSSSQTGAQTQPVSLEAPGYIFVLYRIEQRQVDRIRNFSADCELDGGGLTVYWLTDVRPAESIALLSSFAIQSDHDRREDHRRGEPAIAAIAMHADPAADQALEKFVAADQPQSLREHTVFWLGSARSRHGYEVLRRLVTQDPSERVREKAIFGLSVSREPDAAPAMISVAKNDASPRVRGQALFWLSQKAGHKEAAAITEAVENDPDTDVKKKAVFALSQLPRDEGVPLLIQVARTNRNPAVRKQAIFWLGQSQDSRALQFFEEVLLR
jgi:HEAT repeat protein